MFSPSCFLHMRCQVPTMLDLFACNNGHAYGIRCPSSTVRDCTSIVNHPVGTTSKLSRAIALWIIQELAGCYRSGQGLTWIICTENAERHEWRNRCQEFGMPFRTRGWRCHLGACYLIVRYGCVTFKLPLCKTFKGISEHYCTSIKLYHHQVPCDFFSSGPSCVQPLIHLRASRLSSTIYTFLYPGTHLLSL